MASLELELEWVAYCTRCAWTDRVSTMWKDDAERMLKLAGWTNGEQGMLCPSCRVPEE